MLMCSEGLMMLLCISTPGRLSSQNENSPRWEIFLYLGYKVFRVEIIQSFETTVDNVFIYAHETT